MNNELIILTPKQRENILRDIWIVHDSRWFMNTVLAFGYEKAAELNHKVIKSFAKFEMKRLLKEIDYKGVTDIEDLKIIIALISDLTFPEGFKPEVRVSSSSSVTVNIKGCFVFDNVNKAGFKDVYSCTAYARCSTWFKVLELNGDAKTKGTSKTCNGECEIIFYLNK
jgi:hypothetical protein